MARPKAPRDLFRAFLPELIYGANDGIITTFAIIAGVSGARLPAEIVLILGFANLLGDGVSMGASKYLSSRSEFHEGVRCTRKISGRGAVATFIGFQAGGLMPLLAYLVPGAQSHSFLAACLLTAASLFAVGAARSLVTEIGAFTGGLEMLFIGSIAALVAYGTAVLGSAIVNPSPLGTSGAPS